MSPLFYEDSLGAKLAEKAAAAMDVARGADDECIEDPEALARAESEARGVNPQDDYENVTEEWVTVFGPSKLSGVIDIAGCNARLVSMPLDAEGIAYAWRPYPPEDMPGPAMPLDHAVDRPFSLMVAPSDVSRARELLEAYPGSGESLGSVATHDRSPEAVSTRRTLSVALLIVMFGLTFFTTIILLIAQILGIIH